MNILDNYYWEWKSIREKITELEEENRKLKEERDFFKEQAILWRNDYKNEYKKNRKLKSDLWTVIYERDNAFKKIKQLEERLDNKEKVNNQLRKDIKWYEKEEDRLREENRKLKEENEKLKGKIFFRNNRISWFEWEEERLNGVINTLKKKLENSVWFWKKKVAKLSEENRQLKHRNEILDLSLKASVHPLVYNELVWNIEISK